MSNDSICANKKYEKIIANWHKLRKLHTHSGSLMFDDVQVEVQSIFELQLGSKETPLK